MEVKQQQVNAPCVVLVIERLFGVVVLGIRLSRQVKQDEPDRLVRLTRYLVKKLYFICEAVKHVEDDYVVLEHLLSLRSFLRARLGIRIH